MTRIRTTARRVGMMILLFVCGSVHAQDNDPTKRSPRTLNPEKKAEAIAVCESPRTIDDMKKQGETIDMPAICEPGTTPDAVRIEITMADIGNDSDVFDVMAPWASQSWELHLKLSRRVREFGGCEWTNYGGYGVFPYATVSINQQSTLAEPEVNGVDWISGIKALAIVRANQDVTVQFHEDYLSDRSELPIDCSEPGTLKAFSTNRSDDLSPEELSTAMSVKITPVLK